MLLSCLTILKSLKIGKIDGRLRISNLRLKVAKNFRFEARQLLAKLLRFSKI